MAADWQIRCGFCGHTGPFERFSGSVLGYDYGPGTYRCPYCRKAWRVRRPSERDENGWFPEHRDSVDGTNDRILRVIGRL